jgi:hypothetical protein
VSGNHVAAGRAQRGLPEGIVAEIRRAFAGGERMTSLVYRFGISRVTVNRIVYGRTYRDYGGPIREPRS